MLDSLDWWNLDIIPQVCLEQEAAPTLLQEEDVPPIYTLHHSTAKAATGQVIVSPDIVHVLHLQLSLYLDS